MKISSQVVNIAPFFLGPLVLMLPPEVELYRPWLIRFSIFLILFGALAAMRVLVLRRLAPYLKRMQNRAELKAKRRSLVLLSVLVIMLLAIVVVSALQSFQSRLSESSFYLLLGALGALALSDSYRNQKLWGKDLFFYFSYASIVGFLSMSLSPGFDPGIFYWSPILFACAMAAMVTATRISELLVSGKINYVLAALPKAPPPALTAATTKQERRKARRAKAIADHLSSTTLKEEPRLNPYFGRFTRVFAVLLLLGPSCIAALTYFGQLPPPYLIIMICVAISGRALKVAGESETTGTIPSWFARETTGISLLYIAIITLLRLTR